MSSSLLGGWLQVVVDISCSKAVIGTLCLAASSRALHRPLCLHLLLMLLQLEGRGGHHSWGGRCSWSPQIRGSHHAHIWVPLSIFLYDGETWSSAVITFPLVLLSPPPLLPFFVGGRGIFLLLEGASVDCRRGELR